MKTKFVMVALAGLAACGTPQERCIGGATRELRAIESLLAETEANLARGYAWEEYQVNRVRWAECSGDDDFVPAWERMENVPEGKPLLNDPRRKGGQQSSSPRMCLEDYVDTAQRRVAIDPVTEGRKRDGLVAKSTELSALAQNQIAQCRALHPE